MVDSGTQTDELLSIFKERGFNVKRHLVDSTLNDPTTGQKTVDWMLEHLASDTLLSLEELTL